jgi:hypothetical protein
MTNGDEPSMDIASARRRWMGPLVAAAALAGAAALAPPPAAASAATCDQPERVWVETGSGQVLSGPDNRVRVSPGDTVTALGVLLADRAASARFESATTSYAVERRPSARTATYTSAETGEPTVIALGVLLAD